MYDGPPGASDDQLAKAERARFLDREAAKVYLLLDFLSGRAEQSLRPTQEEQARILIDRQNRDVSDRRRRRKAARGDRGGPV